MSNIVKLDNDSSSSRPSRRELEELLEQADQYANQQYDVIAALEKQVKDLTARLHDAKESSRTLSSKFLDAQAEQRDVEDAARRQIEAKTVEVDRLRVQLESSNVQLAEAKERIAERGKALDEVQWAFEGAVKERDRALEALRKSEEALEAERNRCWECSKSNARLAGANESLQDQVKLLQEEVEKLRLQSSAHTEVPPSYDPAPHWEYIDSATEYGTAVTEAGESIDLTTTVSRMKLQDGVLLRTTVVSSTGQFSVSVMHAPARH